MLTITSLSPAEVEFLQVITLVCTEQETAVFNINSTQYDSCSEPLIEDYQNIHIGKASVEHVFKQTLNEELCRSE